MEQLLSGIRVLDFGRFIAAPWCAAILGDLGADVIRIERREGGEDRGITPVSETGDGAIFLQCNRNKRSMTLDPRTAEGREIKSKLVATADIVIANLPEPVLKSLGLDYASLRAIKPDIILTTASAYGSGGPYSNRIGFDGAGQVMTGAVYRSGTPDAPVRAVTSYIDFGTAMGLLSGTLAAFIHRQNTGQGQHVEGSLLATALMMTNSMLMEQAVLEKNRVGIGNRGTASAPADLFKAKDGWLLIQIAGQPQFKRWCKLMGEPAWYDDPRFATDALRGDNGDILNDRMQAWCGDRSKAEVIARLDEAKIPAYDILSPQQALDDPHIRHMAYYKEINYPGLPKPAPIMETPFRLSDTPGTIRMRPPTTGEHTDEILLGLGYDESQIAVLRDAAVV